MRGINMENTSNTTLNAHYTKYRYQAKSLIMDFNLDFIEGNIIKYIARAEDKGEKEKDIRKAIDYLDSLQKIKTREPKNENDFKVRDFLTSLFVFADQFSQWQEKAILHAGLYILTLSNYHLEQVKNILTTELHGLRIEGVFSE